MSPLLNGGLSVCSCADFGVRCVSELVAGQMPVVRTAIEICLSRRRETLFTPEKQTSRLFTAPYKMSLYSFMCLSVTAYPLNVFIVFGPYQMPRLASVIQWKIFFQVPEIS